MNDVIEKFEKIKDCREYIATEDDKDIIIYLRQNFPFSHEIWDKIILPEEIVINAKCISVSEEERREVSCQLDLVSMVCFNINIIDEDVYFNDEYVVVESDKLGVVIFNDVIFDYYEQENENGKSK